MGEFADALRAQIAEARARLEAARAAKDLEAMTAHLLRLRYLLDVAAENGLQAGVDEAAQQVAPVETGEV